MGFGTSKRRKHSKTGETTLRAYHFRLHLNDIQANLLHSVLDLGCALRNQLCATLEASRQAARQAKIDGKEPQYLSAFDLKKRVAGSLLDLKFHLLHSQVRQDLSMRVIEGQSRWFDALKEGRHHVRPPAEIPRKKFRSITFPQYGTAAKISNDKLCLSKLGEFKAIGWRKMRGKRKSLTLKFKEGSFWAIVMCEVQARDVCTPYALVKDRQETGMDPGVSAVLTDAQGAEYATPRPLAKARTKLCHIQKDVARKFEARKALHLKHLQTVRTLTGSSAPVSEGLTASLRSIPYSKRLKANIVKLAKAHTKVERIRDDCAKKTARTIERKFARVAVEEHGLNFMMRNRRMARAASDVAIGKQKFALKSALGSGRYHRAGNRRTEGGNSQTCLCGAKVPKALSVRLHDCPECGLAAPRDQMSAIIVQHSTFGSVPKLGRYSQVHNEKLKNNSLEWLPGLGILEHAVEMLKTRRREGKAAGSESCSSESKSAVPTARTSEPSVKRPAHGSRLPNRKTTGEAKAANVEVNTAGHASSPCPCPAETKNLGIAKRATIKRIAPLIKSPPAHDQKHPPSGG